jgi:hypothetical protein
MTRAVCTALIVAVVTGCVEPQQLGVLTVNDTGLCTRLRMASRVQGTDDPSLLCEPARGHPLR